MKTVVFKLLPMFFIIGLLPFDGYAEEQKTYTASASYFQYSIDYPSDWELTDIYGFVKIISPLENKSDGFRENIVVTVADLSKKPRSLEEFSNVWLKIIPLELSNFKLLNEDKSVIGGNIGYEKEALFYIYSGSKDAKNFKYKRYIFKNNTNIYEVIYEAKEEDFDKYLPKAESIIRSIKAMR
jgi:hypothetical protein